MSFSAIVEGGRTNKEGEGVGIRSMCFIYLYENRTMKLVEITLSKREGDE
jgi:hypothetical protein